MVINTKQRCVMCRENKDCAYFLDTEGRTTNLCPECRKLMEAFVLGGDPAPTTKILARSGMSADQIADLISPAAAADSVVMKAIGMDVFNNRIKPANRIPSSKLAQGVIGIPPTGSAGEFKFTGIIGFDDLGQPIQQPVMTRKEQAGQAQRQEKQILEFSELDQLYRKATDDIPKPSFLRPLSDEYFKSPEDSPNPAKAESIMGVLKNIDVSAEKAPVRAPEPPAEIGRVARAIAGEDEE